MLLSFCDVCHHQTKSEISIEITNTNLANDHRTIDICKECCKDLHITAGDTPSSLCASIVQHLRDSVDITYIPIPGQVNYKRLPKKPFDVEDDDDEA
jgi:hypothetical protein